MLNRILVILVVFSLPCLTARAAEPFPPIPRVLPPEGLEIPSDVRSRLEKRVQILNKRLEALQGGLKPDIEVFVKAVELALLHREFYIEKDFAKADWALDEAEKRFDSLLKDQWPWSKATGTVVAGYRSSIDGSAQPYGLVIPKDHNFDKPCPLYVWLHGRGDKATDLHFLQERATKPGQITPPNAIVVHPFGRHCVGWKHAGEIDVLEVVESVKQRYKIDPDRVVLIGFSMGGAGAWHIGAHYADHWVAVSPGAGFVDVAKYQKLTPDRYGEWYVQKLWGLYDVPDYVRNFFNTNVIAYSGELDKQREAAVLMEEAFKDEGRTLTHLIGPGVEHKYEPETLKELLKRIAAVVEKGIDKSPNKVSLQTRTLRYSGQNWVAADGLEEHWKDSRIDAERTPGTISLKTINVNRLSVTAQPNWFESELIVDGQRLGPLFKFDNAAAKQDVRRFLGKENGKWKVIDSDYGSESQRPSLSLRKRPGAQGPIDDAFISAFKVVVPTGKSRNSAFQAWCDAELAHFKARWRALMRAELPIISDRDFNFDRLSGQNFVLWGDADSNSVVKMLVATNTIPVQFSAGRWELGKTSFDGNRFVPQLIYPNLHRAGGYFVLNSGLTFREAHDHTNSQQNPKLPDWAIIDLAQPPDAKAPGGIHDADFFDENWQLKRQPKAP